MNFHEFDDDVESVQQKLNDNLPLVDAGVERAKELHDTFSSELAVYDNNYGGLEESLQRMQTEASTLSSRVAAIQAEVEAGAAEVTGGFDEIGQLASASVEQLTAAQQRVESEIETAGTQVESASTSLESQFGALSSEASTMQEQLGTVKQQAETSFSELNDSVGTLATQWQTDESASGQSLDNLQSRVAQSHSSEVKQKFNGLNQQTVDIVGNLVGLFTEKEGGIGEFFSIFDADAESLASGFQKRSEEICGNLKDYTESECGRVLEDALENLVKEGVEAFAAEIVESIATTQIGVMTTSTLSPIIPELVIAKKITGVMNSIL